VNLLAVAQECTSTSWTDVALSAVLVIGGCFVVWVVLR
jgi:hypothetical protein